jgi:hypothetical protein
MLKLFSPSMVRASALKMNYFSIIGTFFSPSISVAFASDRLLFICCSPPLLVNIIKKENSSLPNNKPRQNAVSIRVKLSLLRPLDVSLHSGTRKRQHNNNSSINHVVVWSKPQHFVGRGEGGRLRGGWKFPLINGKSYGFIPLSEFPSKTFFRLLLIKMSISSSKA